MLQSYRMVSEAHHCNTMLYTALCAIIAILQDHQSTDRQISQSAGWHGRLQHRDGNLCHNNWHRTHRSIVDYDSRFVLLLQLG